MTTQLTWDDVGKRLFETGIEKGVLYVMDNAGAYPTGVAWNGLISITESPSGAEANPAYADNIKYLNLMSVEQFGATIEAYSFPVEFEQCDGVLESGTTGVKLGQQSRKQFGLCYRTKIGNDVLGDSYGYKLHFIYGALASPSEKQYQSINDSPEAMTFSWEITTTPVTVAGFQPTSYLVVDSKTANAAKLATLEGILYGAAATPRLPLPAEIITTLT